MKRGDFKKYLVGAAIAVFLLAVAASGAVVDRLWGIKFLDTFLNKQEPARVGQKLVQEESVVIDVVEDVSPSVVTVSIQTTPRRVFEFSPFSGLRSRIEGGDPQDIGTGFVVDEEGLVVTNKHVVSQTNATYKVITKDDQEYEVVSISRDPNNDLAILKINAPNLTAVELGDSENLKVGQFVIAIGTALGEFRQTVTTGVISGLGRGITATDPLEGYVEQLDDVIQTDAAINPGNSGGPLLNSSGQVIGINIAVVAEGENIGFAIPINILKSRLEEFKTSGKFEPKPFLGVTYQMIAQQTAILNDLPQGAFVIDVITGSAADQAGVLINDIITKFDDKELSEEYDLAEAIGSHQVGDEVSLELWRADEILTVTAILTESSE